MRSFPLIAFVTLVLVLGQVSAAGSISKSDEKLMTTNKIADYSYGIKDKAGKDISIDTVKNKIDKSNNLLLDCDILSCVYKVEITAKQELTFGVDTLIGNYIGTGASIQKIFYWDTRSIKKEKPIYIDDIQEQCNVVRLAELSEYVLRSNAGADINLNDTILFCQNITVRVQRGSESYYETERFENTNILTPFSKGGSVTSTSTNAVTTTSHTHAIDATIPTIAGANAFTGNSTFAALIITNTTTAQPTPWQSAADIGMSRGLQEPLMWNTSA